MSDTPTNLPKDVPAEEATIRELLNEATEWLQYARGVTTTLSDLVHEADSIDCKQMSLSLDAIASMTQAGLRRVAEANALWGDAVP